MARVVLPSFDKFETIEGVMDIDEWGAATVRISYYAMDDSEMLTLLRSGDTCPLVAAGMLQSARFIHGSADITEGGVWKVSLSWVGLSVNLLLDVSATPGYQPTAATSPIETHPLFETFAGTPTAPLNGAFFDSQDNFVGFSPSLECGVKVNPKSGVKSYYDSTLKVMEKRGVTATGVQSQADFFKVGKIDIPNVDNMVTINFDLPGITGNRDHLLVSVVLEDMGNDLILMDREWDMSGIFGWDNDIYDYVDTGDASTPTT